MPANADHEREAELRLVGIVQAMEARELLVGKRVEAGARLLSLRIVGDVAGARRLAGEVGMVAHEGDLLSRGAARTAPIIAACRSLTVANGARGVRGLRHPGRQLENVADCCLESGKVHAVEVGKGHGHSRRPSTPRPTSL